MSLFRSTQKSVKFKADDEMEHARQLVNLRESYQMKHLEQRIEEVTQCFMPGRGTGWQLGDECQ